ncbi:MAG: tetratricopeptide repeat protein [Myxococcota bacterium]|jgi:soluble lytic murein transglycosylase-like protein/TolA-binding protein|nr:tetratricopeptide repeat protein [Myxococcota bacterium]
MRTPRRFWCKGWPGLALLALGVLPSAAGEPPSLPPTLLDALVTGDCVTALEIPVTSPDGALRLALARCHVREGDPSAGLALLQDPVEAGLRDFAHLSRAEALLAAKRPEEALRELEPIDTRGPIGSRALLLKGDAFIRASRFRDARDVLRELLTERIGESRSDPVGGVDPAAVRFLLGEGANLRGNAESAVPVWENAWARNPGSPWTQLGVERLAEMGRSLPDTSTDRGRALILERISTLQKRHEYVEALALRDLLGTAGVATPSGELAMAAFRARDYPRSVELFEQLSDPSPEQRFHHALATSRTGDYAAAAILYDKLWRQYPSHRRGDQASYKIGYLAYDDGDLEGAVRELRAHLSRFPSSRHGDEARWFVGWSLLRSGQLEESEAALKELVSRHPSSSLTPVATYWLARLSGMSGDTGEEQEQYEAILRRWPDSGAAWWASERLGRTWAALSMQERPALPAVLDVEAFHVGRSLARVGLDEWARAELEPLVPMARSSGRIAALHLSEALVQAGSYTEARKLGQEWCGQASQRRDAWALRACYPRPSGPLVARLAAAGDLDPNLPFAIMNAESALQPTVTSPAGARGLMQLMPEVGERLHLVRYPASRYDSDDLYRPGYNAALGTAELVALAARMEPRLEPALPAVIAGYNAGPDAVERWLAEQTGIDRGPTGADVFAENIGYSETRRYVRRVLGFLQTYRYVYGDG